MTGIKKIVWLMVGVFVVSGISSAATWFTLTPKQKKTFSWKEALALTAEQQSKFAQLESELDSALKEIELEDAQNRIFLCSYLSSPEITEEKTKSAAKKMAALYGQKQERIARVLVSISGLLNAEQKKIFAEKLMREVCVSCRESTGKEQCLCGMCGS